MGGSSGQVVGYRYFTNLLLFIGNPIEKMLGINFDKRGWISPFVDENGNALAQGVINSPNLYGENEGGVAGAVHVQYGRDDQEVLPFYKDYMESKELPASAYPFQSYLAFKDFYVGNSGYMKEMLLWPKRTRIRNDGSGQWHANTAERPWVCEIPESRSDGSLEEKAKVSQKWFVNTVQRADPHIEINPYGNFRRNDGQVNYTFKAKLIADVVIGEDTVMRMELMGHPGSAPVATSSSSNVEIINTGEPYPGDIYWKSIYTYILMKPGKYQFEVNIISSQNGVGDEPPAPGLISGADIYMTGQLIAPSDYFEVFNKTYGPDINTIHKIREILTDDTAMNKPESSVNDDNFIKAADRIWDEGLGISWSITEKSCIDAINELCYHIEAGIRINRQTGLYEMVLFRDDWFEDDEIHMISESKIKSMSYEITNADEVINQVNVNYYDRANIKNSSFSISESGLIQTLGRVNAETLDFPYFMNMRNAEIVANWKLKQLSTGALKGSFTTGWREARKWNRYDLIRLPWSKRWSGTILVRIMSINLGGPTNNEVSIEFIEVVPSTGMMNTTIVADDPIDKPLPPQACQYEPFELPYYLAVMTLGQRQVDDELAYENNFGLVGTVAEQPQLNSLYAVMMTNNGDEWIRAGSIQYSQTVDLDQIISKTSSSFTVKNWNKISNISVGTLIKCGRDWLGTPGEWMVFQGVDPSTGIVSVKRGALDTQPQEWGLGTKLYFCGNDISYDQTEYVAGEEVLVSALTTTPSGVLEQGGSIPVEMKARAIRPYPPANVKINGGYWPETQLISNNIVLTWSHRNRVQQTGGEIIGWYEGDVTVENGVTYSYELISENVVLDSQSNIAANTVTILASVLKPNKPHTLKLWSVRGGYESYQKFEHSFFIEAASLILTATTNGSSVVGNTVPTANINVIVDESLSANMKFDGISISGKAQAGSTITIEIQE